MPLEVHQFPCLSDNYGYLLHDPASGETVCIDTPDGPEYLRQAEAKGWQISAIWNTHWHPDHAGGNLAIKDACAAEGHPCEVVAPAGEVERIAGVDRPVRGGDVIRLGEYRVEVLDVGGHTLGHIAYHIPEAGLAFVGDSLFALGCGRMFEGTPPQFWTSLSRLKALPPATQIHCAHEYTASNARFALHADPENAALKAYSDEITLKRADGLWTVPFPLSRELETNPFLRADDAALQAQWGGGDAVATFSALRTAKDNFR